MPASISSNVLSQELASFQVIDVRRRAAFDASGKMIATAVWRDPAQVDVWCHQLSGEQPVVVYCVHGHEVSQGCAMSLENAGFDVSYLDGGFAQWIQEGGLLR